MAGSRSEDPNEVVWKHGRASPRNALLTTTVALQTLCDRPLGEGDSLDRSAVFILQSEVTSTTKQGSGIALTSLAFQLRSSKHVSLCAASWGHPFWGPTGKYLERIIPDLPFYQRGRL